MEQPIFAMISTMVEYSDRLQGAMDACGIKIPALAAQLGVSYQAVKKVLDGKSSAFTAERNARVAKLLGINSDLLATGLGEMRPSTEPGPRIRGLVPLISWVRAGDWCEAPCALTEADAQDWLPCIASHSGETFALRVRGDSMTAPHGNSRSYPEGCIIFVDPARRQPSNGERIVACLQDSHEVTFKSYKCEDGRTWLQPLNPSHEPIRQPFVVIGTVLGKWEEG